MAIANTGTKEKLRGWLRSNRNMSYTQYSKMPTELKLKIQKEYQGK